MVENITVVTDTANGVPREIQSGASSQAKNYFSDATGSIQDPIAVPGPCEVTEP